jgi:histone H3/H4
MSEETVWLTVDRIVERTAAQISVALDRMVHALPDECFPQAAIKRVIRELVPLQPWYMQLIMEDPDIKETYYKAVAEKERHTAYHEAGHAVVGRGLGLTCGEATIVPDYEARTAGYSKSHVVASVADWEARGRWRYHPLFRASIFELMAGRETEIVCLGRSYGGNKYDLEEINIRLSEADIRGETEAWLKRARVKTRGLVRRHRVAIEHVAAALLEKKRLSALEIDRIVKQAGSYVVARVSPQERLTIDEGVLARQWWNSPASFKHVRARLRFYKKHARA